MCSEIWTVPGKDPSATTPHPCDTSFAEDPTVDRDDRFTDINGCSYIEVRICDLDRFCSK